MKRMFAIFVFGLMLGLAQQGFVNAAPTALTFTVNQTADLVDANLSDGRCDTSLGVAGDQCSLRAAIQQANATAGTDTIKFVSSAVHKLTRSGIDNTASAGDLDITSSVNIEGRPPATTIDGNGLDRVFNVFGSGAVTFKNLVIQGGRLTTNSQVAAGVEGGAGNLTFEKVTLIDNIVNFVAPPGFSGSCCGGVSDVFCNCLVTFTNSGSTSGGTTSGIRARSVNIQDSEILNHGRFGILVNGGTSTILRTKISNNMGGVGNSGGTLLIKDSEITDSGGGFWLFEVLYAGSGLSNSGSAAVTSVVNSTISDNNSAGDGGGIANFGGTVELFNVTVANNSIFQTCDSFVLCSFGHGGGIFNSSGTVELTNTLVANNQDVVGNFPDCDGTLVSNGFNLIGNTTGCTINGTFVGNKLNVNPLLAPLANNGGPTQTHELLAGSPAIDSGHTEGCEDDKHFPLTTDQRGFPRPTDSDGINGARCDMGAFEVGAVGIGSISPNKGASMPGEQQVFDVAWDSPTRWRDLNNVELRFKRGHAILLWLRFTEGLPNSTFSLLDKDGNVVDSGNVGDAKILENKFGSLDLSQSGFTASGPNDPHVVLHYAVTFANKAQGKLKMQMLATDDFANAQGPETGGTWKVKP